MALSLTHTRSPSSSTLHSLSKTKAAPLLMYLMPNILASQSHRQLLIAPQTATQPPLYSKASAPTTLNLATLLVSIFLKPHPNLLFHHYALTISSLFCTNFFYIIYNISRQAKTQSPLISLGKSNFQVIFFHALSELYLYFIFLSCCLLFQNSCHLKPILQL